MPNSRYAPLQLVLGPALLLTLMPSGCAVGVEPAFEDEPTVHGGSANGGSAGKATAGGSGAGTPSPPSSAGTTSTSGSGANPFGGSAGSGGKGGAGSGGTSGSSAGSGGSSAGSGGTSGSSAGSGGTSAGCACAKTLAWADNMNLSWASGDCVTTGGVTYLYTGTKAQTYANGDCNPAKQLAWCRDAGNDYKFMACP